MNETPPPHAPTKATTPYEQRSYLDALQLFDAVWAPRLADLVDRLEIESGTSILEVGAGAGALSRLLAAASGSPITVLDRSFAHVEHLNQLRNAHEAPVCHAVQGDAGNVSVFADDTFDLIIIARTLHAVRDTAVALQEFARLLKPGGRCVVIEAAMRPRMFPVFAHPQAPDFEAALEALRLRDFAEERTAPDPDGRAQSMHEKGWAGLMADNGFPQVEGWSIWLEHIGSLPPPILRYASHFLEINRQHAERTGLERHVIDGIFDDLLGPGPLGIAQRADLHFREALAVYIGTSATVSKRGFSDQSATH